MEEESKDFFISGEAIAIRESNSCPICKSQRITKWSTYEKTEETDLFSEKRIGRIQNSYAPIYWGYKCRKCGWNSITFSE